MRKSKTVQVIEMDDNEHGLIGLGKISYKYTIINKKHKLVIWIHSVENEIIYEGIKAQNVYKRVINDSTKETVNFVMRLACESCGIPLIRIKEKSNKKEVVWARYMVFWYVKNYLGYTLKDAGNIFKKDHATALHGIKNFTKLNKFLSNEQIMMKNIFVEKLSNNRLLK